MNGARLTGLAMGLSAACSISCTTNLDSLTKGNEADAAPPVMQHDAGNTFPPPAQPPDMSEPENDYVEPYTTFAFTLLHGVVDSPLVFFCFADETGTLVGNPLPQGGLTYGKALVIDSVEGVDLIGAAFRPFVIAADTDVAAGKSCEELAATLLGTSDAGTPPTPDAAAPRADASTVATGGSLRDAAAPPTDAGDGGNAVPPVPPHFRMQGLPIIPKGTLQSNARYLLAVTGCVGGAAFTSAGERAACGENYSPQQSTLTPMLVRLSQIVSFDGPSLQFLQASLAAGVSQLSSVPGLTTDGMPVTISSDSVSGRISPYPPLRSVPLSTFGSPIAQVELQVGDDSGQTWRQTWGDALTLAGLNGIENANGYTLVLVGPNPWLKGKGFWNPARITLVPSTPP